MSEELAWIVLPTIFGVFAYSAVVLCTWPYARPRFTLLPLLLFFLFPPAFPFLLLYLLCVPPVVAAPPAPGTTTVVVVPKHVAVFASRSRV